MKTGGMATLKAGSKRSLTACKLRFLHGARLTGC